MNLTKKQVNWLMLAYKNDTYINNRGMGVLVSGNEYAYCTDGKRIHVVGDCTKVEIGGKNISETILCKKSKSEYYEISYEFKKSLPLFGKEVRLFGSEHIESKSGFTVLRLGYNSMFSEPILLNTKYLIDSLKYLDNTKIAISDSSLHVRGMIDGSECNAVIMKMME